MTTVVTETPIEVAGRRLNPGTSPEWQYLLTHFELSEGFSFVVLLVPDADWANACRIALSQYLEVEGKNLLTVGYSDAEDFKIRVPGRLLELHLGGRAGAVWLEATISEASPRYEEWADAWRGMAARLNQFRNPLRRQFKVPLVFVGAHWIQPAMRDIAPDLWSVRTIVIRLEPLTQSGGVRSHSGEATSEQQREGLAIDPDFALKTAERLRGQSGKELALAQLLYRAGLGLNARSRWTEAESVLREAVNLQREFSAPERLAASLEALAFSLECQYRFDDATKLVDEARALFAKGGDVLGEANCVQSLGDIALHRSDHATAQTRYEEALPLYRRLDDVLGEANCVQRLGEIALRRSDNATAQTLFEEALSLHRRIGDVLGEANCIQRLGAIALRHSDHATAQSLLEQALSLYRRVGAVLGEATSITGLADIALRRSEYSAAQSRYEEALPLYRRVGSVLGEANCIKDLGIIALRRGDQAAAQARYEEAPPLYRRVSDVLGEANCIKGLGEIALKRSDYATAQARFQEALPLYRQDRAVPGEATCIARLGNIARYRSDPTAAKARYEEALMLFRRVGDVLGEANCILSLGDIALEQKRSSEAREKFLESQHLYERIGDPYSIGASHVRLARVAENPAECDEHLKIAREAWERIDRPDLIEEMEKEFNLTEGNDATNS